MRAAIFILLFCSPVFFLSCEKETERDTGSGYIKSLECEYNVITVGSVKLQDNSIVTVARAVDGSVPGFMYKVDEEGNQIWKKRLNEQNKGCYQVYDTRGNGFAVLGYDDLNDTYFQVFMYDDEGNFLYSKAIPFDMFWYSVRYYSVIQMLELSNGNFVFACNLGNLILYFTNSSFEPIFRKEIDAGYSGSFVRGLYQTSDTTLLFANAWSLQTPPFTTWQYDVRMIQTDLNGDAPSSVYITDTLLNETPNALLPMSDKMLLVTGLMGLFNQGGGALVNYLNNQYTVQISGAISLVHTGKDGSFISRQTIQDYPANGMIMNARTTMDGGYILCGTVNQSDVTNIISPAKIYIMKVSSAGRFEWSRFFKTPYPSYGIDAIQASDGGYFISGYMNSFDKRFNPVVIKTDPNGNI